MYVIYCFSRHCNCIFLEEEMRNQLSQRDDFYPQIVKLVIPIIIQNLLSAAVNSADVIMLNFVGQSSISAVSLAANYSNVLFMVYYGLGTGATLLCAQYYGKGDYKAIQIIEGIALRSIGRVTTSMAMNMLAFGLNVLLNATFIFGLFGAPKLGATGVAIATALSRMIELIACFIVSAFSKNVRLDLRCMFIKNKLLFSDFVRLSLPALGNDISWSIGFSMYSVILGHLGTDAVAANSLVVVVRNIGSVFCFGIASAGGILLGNVMGQGDLERSRRYASKTLKLTVIAGFLGGLIVLAITPFVMRFASLTPTAMHYLKYMLLINSYYIMGSAVNTTLIAGVFRAGGDTKFGLICDTIDMWVYAVPLGFFAAFVLKLPVMWVYFLLCTDEFVKWPWVIKRYLSGKWAKNITRENIFENK